MKAFTKPVNDILGASTRTLLKWTALAWLYGCSGWVAEDIDTVRPLNGSTISDFPDAVAGEVCTVLNVSTFEVRWSFCGVPVDYKTPVGVLITPGAYELDDWRRWIDEGLDYEQAQGCKRLLFSDPVPRRQTLSVSEPQGEANHIALRTDFPERAVGERTEVLEFDATFDAINGSYIPTAERPHCKLTTGDPAVATWYGADPLVGSGVRLIAVPEGLIVEIPYDGRSYCGVVEHYVPAGAATRGACGL